MDSFLKKLSYHTLATFFISFFLGGAVFSAQGANITLRDEIAQALKDASLLDSTAAKPETLDRLEFILNPSPYLDPLHKLLFLGAALLQEGKQTVSVQSICTLKESLEATDFYKNSPEHLAMKKKVADIYEQFLYRESSKGKRACGGGVLRGLRMSNQGIDLLIKHDFTLKIEENYAMNSESISDRTGRFLRFQVSFAPRSGLGLLKKFEELKNSKSFGQEQSDFNRYIKIRNLEDPNYVSKNEVLRQQRSNLLRVLQNPNSTAEEIKQAEQSHSDAVDKIMPFQGGFVLYEQGSYSQYSKLKSWSVQLPESGGKLKGSGTPVPVYYTGISYLHSHSSPLFLAIAGAYAQVIFSKVDVARSYSGFSSQAFSSFSQILKSFQK